VTGEVLVEEVIDIVAPREVVFELLTTARGLLEWIAVDAECEPAPGGVIRWRHENGAVMSGRFLTVEPPSRVVFSYGWERGGPDVPPGSTEVEIVLDSHDAGTRLRLVHRRLSRDVAREHQAGWRWFLGRLAERSRGEAAARNCPREDPKAGDE
jgi:uncharacterized protein YndB with AHSA1/START domain